MSSFAELGVPADLISTLRARGIDAPFAIQTLTIADGVAGLDLCGRAPTGSGKTLAFGIPLVARLGRANPRRPRGLVLVPTRELAAQVCSELEWLSRPRKLRVAAFYGGAGFGLQLKNLRRGVDIVVACPGRLTDLIERGEVDLREVEIVVVDEADRMADMGFLPAVKHLLDMTPETRQTLLFSATLDGAVDALVRRYQRDPVRHVLPETAADKLRATHVFWKVERDERVQLTADVIKLAGPTIVFCKTKHGTDDAGQEARPARRAHRGHPREPHAGSARARARVVHPWSCRRADRDRRRGTRHPRRRRRLRDPLRPAERLEGLHAPLGSHRTCGRRGHGGVVREPRPGRATSRRMQKALKLPVGLIVADP